MDLIITKKKIGELAINYEELKLELSTSLEIYKEIQMVDVISESDYVEKIENTSGGFVIYKTLEGKYLTTFKDAKIIRAFLNKISKVINDRKIEIKKEFLKPYEEVEKQAKELIALCENANSNIAYQITTQEEKQKLEKKRDIEALYDSLGFTLVKLEKIWNPKWLNKDVSFAQIKENMVGRIDRIKADLKFIGKIINADVVEIYKSKYLDCIDLDETLRQYSVDMENKKRLEEEAQKQKELQVQKELEELERKQKGDDEPKQESQVQEQEYEVTIIIKGTKSKIRELYTFLKTNNFKVRKGE